MPVLQSWLSAGQQRSLDQLAPERIKLPNDRNARITYGATHAPTIAARIQDLYGVENGLTIGQGRIKLRIEVLAPNHRPIQVTDDLATFWRESYPENQTGVAAQISQASLALEPFGLTASLRLLVGPSPPHFVCLMSNFFLLLRALSSRGLQSLVAKMRIEGRKMTMMCELRS